MKKYINLKSICLIGLFFILLFLSLFVFDVGINSKYFIKRDFNKAFSFRVTGDCETFKMYILTDIEKWFNKCKIEKNGTDNEQTKIRFFKVQNITYNFGDDRAYLQVELTRNTNNILTKEFVYSINYEMKKNDNIWKIDQSLTPTVNVSIGSAPTKGDKNAPVTIVEYSDFECPFCGRFHESTLPQLVTDYIDKGKVLFVYKHFPFSFHKNSKIASLAAECAKKQGGDNVFYKYHDILYTNQTSLTVENLKKWAADMSLDTAKFNSCLDTQKYAKQVDADLAEGQSYGVSGTPTFFINGRMLSGAQPFSTFKTIIDEELSKVK